VGPVEHVPVIDAQGPEVEAVLGRLYQARLDYALGQTEKGARSANVAALAADASGLVALKAEALASGIPRGRGGPGRGCREDALRALLAAQAAHADALVVRVLSRLVFVSGYVRGAFDEAGAGRSWEGRRSRGWARP